MWLHCLPCQGGVWGEKALLGSERRNKPRTAKCKTKQDQSSQAALGKGVRCKPRAVATQCPLHSQTSGQWEMSCQELTSIPIGPALPASFLASFSTDGPLKPSQSSPILKSQENLMKHVSSSPPSPAPNSSGCQDGRCHIVCGVAASRDFWTDENTSLLGLKINVLPSASL